MNIYTAHILFELHDTLTDNAFRIVKATFNRLLAENKPQEAEDFLVGMAK